MDRGSERQPLVGSGGGGGQVDALQAATERTSQFNAEVAQLLKLSDQLGTQKDTPKLRQQLRIKREDCANMAKTTMQYLKRIKIEKSQKIRFDKIMHQFNEIFNRCQVITKESIQKERVTPLPTPAPSEPELEGYKAYPVEKEPVHGDLQQLSFESYSVESSIIEERNEDMKFLENELKGLNEMFVDVATMVKEQGEHIDTIEQNTQQAAVAAEKGAAELRKASEYQKSARGKLCILALIVTLILAAVAGFIWIYFGVLKH